MKGVNFMEGLDIITITFLQVRTPFCGGNHTGDLSKTAVQKFCCCPQDTGINIDLQWNSL